MPNAYKRRTLLGQWLNHLDEICCKEVIVNTHYLANDVEKFISHQQFAGMRITCSHEMELLGTGERYGIIVLSFRKIAILH